MKKKMYYSRTVFESYFVVILTVIVTVIVTMTVTVTKIQREFQPFLRL